MPSGQKQNLEGQGKRQPRNLCPPGQALSARVPEHLISLQPVTLCLLQCKPISLAGFLSFVILSVVPVLHHRSPKWSNFKEELSSVGNERGFERSYSFHSPLARGIQCPSPETRTRRGGSQTQRPDKGRGTPSRAQRGGPSAFLREAFEISPCPQRPLCHPDEACGMAHSSLPQGCLSASPHPETRSGLACWQVFVLMHFHRELIQIDAQGET